VPVPNTFRYDPETNCWEEDAISEPPVTEGIHSHSACYMDGHIYVVGGFDGADDTGHWYMQPDLLIYSIADDTWTTGTAPTHLVADATMVCDSGTIYLVNGLTDVDEDGVYHSAGGSCTDTGDCYPGLVCTGDNPDAMT
jgi:N-acetylneuraminic acid mutarotase